MARTLIIKGASFLTNKVATVVFSAVPCTGIEFSTDTINITGNESVEISYTVTPSDTTDAVTWASSNTDIVTVSDGVLTVLGVGTCTVTATCGEYSASATVTVTIYANPAWFQAVPSTNNAAHVLYWSSSSSTYATAYGQGGQAGEYKIYNAIDTTDNKPIIKLPGNTGRVKISVTDSSYFENNTYTRFYCFKDISAQWSNVEAAYFDSELTVYNIRTETTKIFTVPEGIDAMAFSTKFVTNKSSVAEVEAAFAASGFKIEFLPPATE